jgi:hypothetical protein
MMNFAVRGALLSGLVLMVTACTETRYVGVPMPDYAVVTPAMTPVLQACADHAANAQKAAFGDSFKALQLDTDNLVVAKASGNVGKQPVGAIFDGEGQWYGRPTGTMGEWRRVKFHCMVSPVGNVVYSFVRGE